MSVVFSLIGRRRSLGELRVYFGTLQVRLFKNDHVPLPGDTISDYTEATFTGYAAVTAGPWSAPGTNGDGKEEISAPTLTFETTATSAPQTVYGYYLTDPFDGALVWAERGPGMGQPMGDNGSSYAVTPRVTVIDDTTS